MDGPRLYGILIENFRSIDRKVKLRLDAPVVLVHGQNGTGKTSLLSAIELALTGAVPSMLRADPDYLTQLLHKGSKQGRVVLELKDVQGITEPLNVNVTLDGVTKAAALGEKFCKFFSERCYLPQSALTQLLTIYQESDAGINSLLSQFVSELLGLDRLDALEIGLESARDLRNARRLAPKYLDVEQELARLRREVDTERARLVLIEKTREESAGALAVALRSLGIAFPETDTERSNIQLALSSASEEPALVDLADRNRQLIAFRREYERLAHSPTVEARSVMSLNRAARQQLANWRSRYAAQIESALANIRPYFPNAELGPDLLPGMAVGRAINATTSEIKRLEQAEGRLRAANRRLVELNDADRRGQARIAELDREIASIAADAGPLSLLLSEMLTHIRGEDCPVCGRDFREVSKEPLASSLAKKAAALSDRAERLRALTAERNSQVNQLAASAQERSQIEAQNRLDGPLLDIQDRLAKLRSLLSPLQSLHSAALEGDSLLRAEMAARPSLTALGSTADAEVSLRSSLAAQAGFFDVTIAPGEQLDAVFGKLDALLKEKEVALKARLEARTTALHQLRQFGFYNDEAIESHQKIEEWEREIARVKRAFDSAERIRNDVRRVLSVASSTRATIAMIDRCSIILPWS